MNATPNLIFPTDDFALQRNGATQLVTHFRPLLYDLLGNTARYDREYGTSVWIPAEWIDPAVTRAYASEIEEGGNDFISSDSAPASAPIFYEIHTHPIPGMTSFSDADYRSMVGELLQFPSTDAQRIADNPSVRVFAVLTQRFGDEDSQQATLKTIETTPKVSRLPIEKQRELSKGVIEATTGEMLRTAGDLLEPFSEYLTVHRATFDLPAPIGQLRFGSAIPSRIDDREFGNAYADGDLTDVLRGIDYE